jgi:hypothetical protein
MGRVEGDRDGLYLGRSRLLRAGPVQALLQAAPKPRRRLHARGRGEWRVDDLLFGTVRAAVPPHKNDELVAHYRGLRAAWAANQP